MRGVVLSSRPGRGGRGSQPRQQPQPQEESSSSPPAVSQRNAGKETYTGQRVLAAVPPPGKTGSSGKEGRVVIPPFPVLEPFPQQQQQQLRF